MEHVTNQSVQTQFEQYLQSATNQDKEILSSILTNLQQKKDTSGSYLSALIKMEAKTFANKQLEMTIPISPIIHNSLDIVHGGITATLADSTMGTLVHRLLPEHQTAVTTNLSVQYIRPGKGTHLSCTASVTHQGKQLCVTEARVVDDRGKLVATANGTFMVIAKSK
ncbi:PaaI family thioesterase [Alkalihalobacillus sp. NPDC078783]